MAGWRAGLRLLIDTTQLRLFTWCFTFYVMLHTWGVNLWLNGGKSLGLSIRSNDPSIKTHTDMMMSSPVTTRGLLYGMVKVQVITNMYSINIEFSGSVLIFYCLYSSFGFRHMLTAARLWQIDWNPNLSFTLDRKL